VSLGHALAYRLIQAARREPVFTALREIETSQWWPVDRLREDQLRRLRRVLAAAAGAPFYRAAWSRAGVVPAAVRRLEDLAAFPTVEKAHLRSNPGAFRAPGYRGPLNVHVTTGSSGVPLRVLRSRLAGACGRAAQIRGRGWFGLSVGDREVLYGGSSLEQLGRGRARLIDALMNRVRLDPFDLSDERLARCLDTIRRARPRFLYGYPSALAILAAFVERTGSGRDLGLALVQCSSERLYDHRREIIRRAFGCPVADEYGAAEVSILAMDCPQGRLHQAAENVYIEITDPGGLPVPPGAEGEVVVTDLNNLAAPLVRYRLGDRARAAAGSCPCGRGLPLMEVVEGSSFGLVRLPDGRRLSGVVFYFLAESLIMRPDAGLSEIVIVRRGNSFCARAVPRPGVDPSRDCEDLRRRLVEILGPGAEVEVTRVPHIERRGGDKYRVLVEESP
jgi:phenylacetate-CoA ligase